MDFSPTESEIINSVFAEVESISQDLRSIVDYCRNSNKRFILENLRQAIVRDLRSRTNANVRTILQTCQKQHKCFEEYALTQGRPFSLEALRSELEHAIPLPSGVQITFCALSVAEAVDAIMRRRYPASK